ncbi:hypothetical protein B0T17DRAFT_508620 [Bombardia bombarda]|uniref:Uncharacterized protein n=1 Tax=Bombardia bombarda TaxID=252184 RepID=A0AA39WTE9_9PEZI|nr:hypothetical protein B0T17DRAFT_508620 [Bombardia bombarda]
MMRRENTEAAAAAAYASSPSSYAASPTDESSPEPVSGSRKPSEAGYFSSAPTSHRSSMSSSTSGATVLTASVDLERDQRVVTTTTTTTTRPKVDAMSCKFPKPTQEATLEEMLARPPQKWSVGHYVKHARDYQAPAVDKEKQAKAFADTKRELLKAKEDLKMLALGRNR